MLAMLRFKDPKIQGQVLFFASPKNRLTEGVQNSVSAEAAPGFGQFAELAVHGLDGIGGVNRRAHVIRIFEVRGQG